MNKYARYAGYELFGDDGKLIPEAPKTPTPPYRREDTPEYKEWRRARFHLDVYLIGVSVFFGAILIITVAKLFGGAP